MTKVIEAQFNQRLEKLPVERSIEVLKSLIEQDHGHLDRVFLTYTLIQQLRKSHQYLEAGQLLEAALEHAPDDADLNLSYGANLIDLGYFESGVARIRKAALSSSNAWHMTCLLFLSTRLTTPPADLLALHHQYGKSFGGGSFQFKRDMNRSALNIGYVSGDFRYHSVASFIAPVFRHHHANVVKIFCFMAGPEDEHSAKLRKSANLHWYNIESLSDDQFLNMVRTLEIDILVDVSGHTKYTRLPVFGRRAAPIQVSWLAYMYTTGLQEMDYRLSNPGLIAPSEVANYSEQIYWLPHTTAVWESMFDLPERTSPPCTRRGYTTFAVLGTWTKVNRPAIDAWTDILNSVPDSRLLILSASPSSSVEERASMALHYFPDIPPHRITFSPRIDLRDFLKLLSDIDIILDTFPVTGGTNTMYALSMGVPTVSLLQAGEMAGAGSELIMGLGFSELVGKQVHEYKQIAIDLANSPSRLGEYRESLPKAFDNSPIRNFEQFASDLEAAYANMYRAAIEAGRITEIQFD